MRKFHSIYTLIFFFFFLEIYSQNIRIDYFVESGEKVYRNYLITNERESIWKYLSEDALVQEDHLENEYLYKNYDDNMLYKTDGIFNQKIYLADSLNQIKWTLTNETRIILGKKCQSARAIFRGRSYTAWYAPSIHVSNGPWKLGGLPGLILEAQTDDKLFKYYASELDENYTKGMDIPDIKSEHFISWSEFKDKFKSVVNNYLKSVRASGVIDDDSNFKIRILAPEIIYSKVQDKEGITY